MTIWACQAGKDVYVEKPISQNIVEGVRMLQCPAAWDSPALYEQDRTRGV